jgi:hypothetical protein
LQLDVIKRNRCLRQPARRAEQRCSFDRDGFRVVAGRGDGEFVPMFAEVVPDAEPLLFAVGEQRVQSSSLLRSGRRLQAEDAVAVAPGEGETGGTR